jgi:predicted amidohydrolase
MKVALVSDVFHTADGEARLRARLRDAKARGADLVLLPEIPLNPWSPATTAVREDDAEAPEGARHQVLARAAREASVGVVGGAIIQDPRTGARHNTALVFDGSGRCVARYGKVHLPDEPGFHEPSHYQPADGLPGVIEGFGLPFGIQICSDLNRPQLAHALAAQGAAAILHPRATEIATYERWKLVMRATAMTACVYVLSVNRPGPEQGVPLGGPSVALDPNGDVILETSDPVCVVELDAEALAAAKRRYPGYLAVNAALYARSWAGVG